MVMGLGKKRYVGGLDSEEVAARIYDWLCLLTQGLSVSTPLITNQPDLIFPIPIGTYKFQLYYPRHLENP